MKKTPDRKLGIASQELVLSKVEGTLAMTKHKPFESRPRDGSRTET